MDSRIVKIFSFEKQPLTAISFKGRPAFIAKEIGQRLGYADNGAKLPKLIKQEWAESFVDGKHYTVIQGKELSDLKKALPLGTYHVLSRAPHLMLLFETGIHKVALKSQKPEAERLQDFLADEVMPQLVRDGRYSPHRRVVDGELKDDARRDEIETPVDREKRLMRRERRLMTEQRARGLKLAVEIARRAGVSEDTVAVFEMKHAEILYGNSLDDLLQAATQASRKSPTEIPEEIRCAANVEMVRNYFENRKHTKSTSYEKYHLSKKAVRRHPKNVYEQWKNSEGNNLPPLHNKGESPKGNVQ